MSKIWFDRFDGIHAWKKGLECKYLLKREEIDVKKHPENNLEDRAVQCSSAVVLYLMVIHLVMD